MKNFFRSIPTLTLIWVLVCVLALIWGSSYLLLKKALDVFKPSEVIAGRMLFASLIMLPYALREVKNIPRTKWLSLILFALLANFITTYLNALAQSRISSSMNGILSALTPLMTLLIGVILYQQKIRIAQVLGLLLGMGGSVMLVFFSPGNEMGELNLYALVAIMATFFTGWAGNMIRFNLQGLSVIQISSVAFLIILPFAALYTGYSGLIPKGLASGEAQWALVYIILLALFANAIGILLFAKIIELSNPVFASLVTYLVPIIALLWGLWDGEEVNQVQLLGMSIIIMSVWIVGRAVNR